jgi:hypothetical protein
MLIIHLKMTLLSFHFHTFQVCRVSRSHPLEIMQTFDLAVGQAFSRRCSTSVAEFVGFVVDEVALGWIFS